MRWFCNLASMATGLGITRNMVDCYTAIIALYEEGDRIFLIGFDRENRADFKPVGWSPTAEKQDEPDAHGNLYFQQVWFPGVHADVCSGYLENEAQLPDLALNWLLAGASLIPGGLKHDGSVLRLSPDPHRPSTP